MLVSGLLNTENNIIDCAYVPMQTKGNSNNKGRYLIRRESCICSINAQILTYDEQSGQWAPLINSRSPSKVQIYQNSSTHKCRIIAWSLPDREVIVNYSINPAIHYNQVSSTFHHWWEGNRILALNFGSEKDGNTFSGAITSCLQFIEGSTSSSQGLPMPPQMEAHKSDMLRPQQQNGTLRKKSLAQSVEALNDSNSRKLPTTLRSTSVPDKAEKPVEITVQSKSSSQSACPPPPPPPPPKPKEMSKSVPNSGGGLAAALQGAKLSKTDTCDSSETPSAKPGKMSMMEEMEARLKRRQNLPASEPKSPKSPPPQTDKNSNFEPSRPQLPRIQDKPKAFPKSTVQLPSKSMTGGTKITLNADELKDFKKELIEIMRQELQDIKQQIITELLQELKG